VERSSLSIRVNGSAREVAAGATVAELVAELALDPRTVAVERNGRIVPRASQAATALERGDELEIVTLVGGG
jgi:thiamine biosynthesis protein ThiS